MTHKFCYRPENSYGYREGRSCADAIGQCFNSLANQQTAKWVLEADIQSCFDGISHEWLTRHILTDKAVLNKWLKAGYVEGKSLFPTATGTPQGGIISPILANMTLDGLEDAVHALVPRLGSKVNVIRYADDFIVTAKSRELLEEKIKPTIVRFLEERGLFLSQEKTTITHIESGFDFLGKTVRKIRDTLLITPSKANEKSLRRKIRQAVQMHGGTPAEALIKKLNPLIRGWANYHRHTVSSECFARVDHITRDLLWRWAERVHPNKSAGWITKQYFGSPTGVFSVRIKGKDGKPAYYLLCRAADTAIQRHRKVRSNANPYSPQDTDYFAKRKWPANRICGQKSFSTTGSL